MTYLCQRPSLGNSEGSENKRNGWIPCYKHSERRWPTQDSFLAKQRINNSLLNKKANPLTHKVGKAGVQLDAGVPALLAEAESLRLLRGSVFLAVLVVILWEPESCLRSSYHREEKKGPCVSGTDSLLCLCSGSSQHVHDYMFLPCA